MGSGERLFLSIFVFANAVQKMHRRLLFPDVGAIFQLTRNAPTFHTQDCRG